MNAATIRTTKKPGARKSVSTRTAPSGARKKPVPAKSAAEKKVKTSAVAASAPACTFRARCPSSWRRRG